ncbi:MAG: hypothetical protein J5714_03910 [Alphaproteobacteria bacterium]|nr:hypothetical protein [Alphaproteobacteria bacterium]
MEQQEKALTPYYAIVNAISEAKRRHKKISVEINGINLTVDEESDAGSMYDLYVRLLVPTLNRESEEIWKKIEDRVSK